MADKEKDPETSLTSKLTPKKNGSSTQSHAKRPKQFKHHESSFQKFKPKGFGKKIFIKLRTHGSSSQSYSPKHKHLKHGAGKVIVGSEEARGNEDIQVPLQVLDKVMKFVEELLEEKRKKIEATKKKKVEVERIKKRREKEKKERKGKALREQWARREEQRLKEDEERQNRECTHKAHIM
uniref:Stress response protein NST1-like n=1 Tax=Cucumis melo TaxID=3656 RepID=A0A9I9D6F0_CUCME